MKRLALTLLQAAITVALLGWLFSKPEISQGLVPALRDASILWLGWGVLLAGVVVLLGCLRWQLFLRVQGVVISFRENLQLSLIAGFFNLVLIGTVGGDAVKAIYLIRRFPAKTSEILLSVLMDRFSGIFPVLGFFVLFSLPRHAWFEPSGLSFHAFLFCAAYLGGMVVIVIALVYVAKRGWLHRTREGRLGRRQIIAMSDALLRLARDPRLLCQAAALSFVVHLVYFATFQAAAEAVGAALPFTDTLAIMPVVDVISAVPVSISGLGVRESFFEVILHQLLGIAKAKAVSVSLLGFGFSVVWSLLGAIVFLGCRLQREDGKRESLRNLVKDAAHLPDAPDGA